MLGAHTPGERRAGGVRGSSAAPPPEEAPSPSAPNCLAASLPHVAISKDDQSALISAVIAALGVVGWEEAKAGPERKADMKGPTSGPVWVGQAPAASDALPDPLPLCSARSACPALFSVAMTLIWQEGIFWSLTGRAINEQLS